MIKTIADLLEEPVIENKLQSKISLYEIDLIEGDYGFREWIDDIRAIDRVLYEFALHLSTQCPVYDCLKLQKELEDDYFRSEFFLKNSNLRCDALGVAFLSDGIAISLPSQDEWLVDSVDIEQCLYDETDVSFDSPGCSIHRVRHASQAHHVDSVIKHWRREFIKQINNAQRLLEYWDSVFPNLDQCKESHLLMLQGETLVSTIGRLWQLEETCQEWKLKDDNSPVYPMKARPESKETMQQKNLADMRLSTCPHQGFQHFTMHCDIQPKGFRLYWLENRQQKRITIGYVGSHLQTVRDKTN